MKSRTLNALGLSAVIVFAAAAISAAVMGRRDQKPALLDLVPADAEALVTFDLQAIGNSPLAPLAPAPVPSGPAGAECQQALLGRVQNLAVARLGGALGIAAKGSFTAAEHAACARSTIDARGGQPLVQVLDGFCVITDAKLGDDAAAVAVKDPGLAIVGPRAARETMLAALSGRVPKSSQQGWHKRIRDELEAGAIMASVVLTSPVKAQAAQALELRADELEPLDALGASVQTGAMTTLRVRVWCRSQTGCEVFSNRLEARRQHLSASVLARAIGLASILETAQIRAQGATASVQVQAPSEQVLDLVQRLTRQADPAAPAPLPHEPRPAP